VNVINGLQNTSSVGSGVTAYTPTASGAVLSGSDFIETSSVGIRSWRGIADPAAPFDLEFGTALYFSVTILSSAGATIRLADLNVTETYLGTSFGSSAIGGTYRSTLLGIDGSGNVLNNGQDPNTLVAQLYYVGVGFEYPALAGSGTNQEIIDQNAAAIRNQSDRTTQVCYDLGGADSSCAQILVEGAGEVPEPSSVVLVGMMSFFWVLRHWSRR